MNLSIIKSLTFRPKTSHKGQSGHVLIVAGSEDYVGAPILAGLAALRSGCDIVTIAAPEKVAWAISCYTPDLITKKLQGSIITTEHLQTITDLIRKCNVLLVGNGLGLNESTKELCRSIIYENISLLNVIDADAIKSVSLTKVSDAIITPHSKELEILLDNSGLSYVNEIQNISEKTKEVQKHIGTNVLLLKGHVDYIISNKKIKKIVGGNPGLAKAGTGDVLAGLCAGFLAQSKDLFKSAEGASRLNKEIGNILLKKKGGYYFIASDMVEEIKRIQNP